jgi:hypothetical protein
MGYLIWVAMVVWYAILGLALLLVPVMAWQDGRKRTCGFLGALIICVLLTPLFGYFVVHMFPLKVPLGCSWCGNERNESEYCGVCDKNKEGQIKRTEVVLD